jgi:hypothetical protein
LLLLHGSPAWPKNPDHVIHLELNEPAPFSGELYPTDLAVKLSKAVERCRESKMLELEKLAKIHMIELDGRDRAIEIERERADSYRQIAENRGEPPRWYQTTEFTVAASVLSTLAIVAVAGYVFGEVTE